MTMQILSKKLSSENLKNIYKLKIFKRNSQINLFGEVSQKSYLVSQKYT